VTVEVQLLKSGVFSGRCDHCNTVVSVLAKWKAHAEEPPTLGVSVSETIKSSDKVV
jgi:hypothetical protein